MKNISKFNYLQDNHKIYPEIALTCIHKNLSSDTTNNSQLPNILNKPFNPSLKTMETSTKESLVVQSPEEIPSKVTQSGRKVTRKMNTIIFETAPFLWGRIMGPKFVMFRNGSK